MTQLTYRSYAKINLSLHITGRREDGYHLLDSLVAPIDVCDEISFERHHGFALECDENVGCATADNIITKSVLAFCKHYNIEPNIKISVKKNIPTGAGLGGGSADAAATLHALPTFFNIEKDISVLHSIASELGSDIVACLSGKPIIMRGAGNEILPAPALPACYGLLIKPPSSCATPDVYQAYRTSKKVFSSHTIFPAAFQNFETFCDFMNENTANDLTSAAIIINNDVAAVLKYLEKESTSPFIRMTGSGSACFALFEKKEQAEIAKNKASTDYPEWWNAVFTIKATL